MPHAREWVGVVALASLLWEGGDAKAGAAAVQCGDTLTQHTKLTRDLSCPGTEAPALRVVGEGVVLDLGGHTVRRTGPEMGDSQGIVVEANGTVRNGTIRGFRWGYVLDSGANNVRLHELSLVGNGTAIYHRGGYARFLITNSVLRGNSTGMSSEFDAATGEFNIHSSLFTGNGRVMFVDAHDVDVLGSTFNSNENVIECFNGNIRIRSSILAMNTAVGSLAFDPAGGFDFCSELRFEDTMIANNTALAPPEAPVWGPFRFVMRNSWVVNNGSGLHAGSRTVYLEGNTFWDNAGGLTLADLPEFVPYPLTGLVRGNRFLRNAGDGLRVLEPSTPTLVGNTAVNNVGWGIHAPTAFDAGGNVARGNGAGNCEGVTCSAF
ncbi:right-handed parallel beta-helix repeat-containing protein [Corallococcus praedator]|uniref:Right-handed parallel beta-helix repeat-containing protein n=1 Tax=Corallococcus praedator TaxID=2316724 RepID=A0ABX9QPW0_9BACT|nr:MULTISPECIES: right-handed parallel beta-helix repeat-containing protein [Corallococcus]RKH36010.1 right-handed parallel beta-helix repeat-containing protein [Corallococcus sp. CA031C]RKI15228.1 right-handed parallel beta-helix repeat-containing protein [Corallococcus praedator]